MDDKKLNVLEWTRMIKSNMNDIVNHLQKMWILAIEVKDGVDPLDDSLPYYKRYRLEKYYQKDLSKITITLDFNLEMIFIEKKWRINADGSFGPSEHLVSIPLEECIDPNEIKNGITNYFRSLNTSIFRSFRFAYRQRIKRIKEKKYETESN